jgi:hypothetical protein
MLDGKVVMDVVVLTLSMQNGFIVLGLDACRPTSDEFQMATARILILYSELCKSFGNVDISLVADRPKSQHSSQKFAE